MKFGELRKGDIFIDTVFGYNMKIGYHVAEDDEEVNAVCLDTGITHWWSDDEEVTPAKDICINVDNGLVLGIKEV